MPGWNFILLTRFARSNDAVLRYAKKITVLRPFNLLQRAAYRRRIELTFVLQLLRVLGRVP